MKKDLLIEILEKLRKNSVCAYVGNSCDCKYIQKIQEYSPQGEHNGCCELMDVIHLLKNMTDKEFQYYLGRDNAKNADNADWIDDVYSETQRKKILDNFIKNDRFKL